MHWASGSTSEAAVGKAGDSWFGLSSIRANTPLFLVGQLTRGIGAEVGEFEDPFDFDDASLDVSHLAPKRHLESAPAAD